jgi:HEAT repeat protein
MNTELDDFLTQLPTLLRLLADPMTPHTSLELWCRIKSFGWTECIPVLQSQLQIGSSDVKRLTLSVITEECNHFGNTFGEDFQEHIAALLDDEDRLVRSAAIQTVSELSIPDTELGLRSIVCNDEPILAAEALFALLETDKELLDDVVQFVRDRSM